MKTSRNMDNDIYPTPAPRLCIRIWRGSAVQQALYGLKQNGRAWYRLLSVTLVECIFEQCLADPCAFRLMFVGDVVARTVFHVGDIKILAPEEVTGVVISALIQRFATKHLGKVEWSTWTVSTRETGRKAPWGFNRPSSSGVY